MMRKIAAYFLIPASAWICLSESAQAAISVPFTVNMSEAVNVSGCPANCPRIAVTVDGQTRYADYSSGSGTSSLTFTYSPTIGDLDLDGVTLTSPLDLNGGTITDLSGNALTPLTFTVPNTSGVKIDYPSLSMDFTYDADGRYTLNGTAYNDLSSFLGAAGGTFSRASTATYYDSTGTLQTASNNVPRFDYDPVTHAAKGLLMEEARTNTLLKSEELENTSYWTADDGTVTPNATIAPDGTMTADLFIPNTVSAQHRLKNSATSNLVYLTAGQTYTASVFVKSAGYDYHLLFWHSSGNAFVRINTSTGAVTSQGGSEYVSNTVQALSNGWYRVSVTLTTVGGGYYTLMNYAYNGSTGFSGDGSSGIYVWGNQIEQGEFATSYIPTDTSTVTRINDALSVPIGGWFNASTGTFNIDAINGTDPTLSAFGALRTDSSNRISIIRTDTNNIEYQVRTGNVSQAQQTLTTGNGDNALDKACIAYEINNVRASVNGTLSALDTSVTIPSITELIVGNWAGSGHINGNIKNLNYYPARVTDTQLQLLTQ